jgi:DNA-binding MarR family transcriptional regulator
MDTSILFDVFALNQSVGRLLAAAMRAGPLTPAEYAVYSAVFELEAATPTRLAARLGMRLTTFMDQLHVLERRGHAIRVEHPTDRRSYRVVLTAAGLEAHRGANRLFEAAHRAFEACLPDGEAAVQACLRSVRGAAEAAAAAMAEGVSPRRQAGRAG